MLTALMGAPGAGKTTYVAGMDLRGAEVISTEALKAPYLRQAERTRYRDGLHRRAAEALYAGRHVVVDAPNTRREHRLRWLHLARSQGSRAVLVVVHATLAEALAGVADRDDTVAEPVVRSYLREFDAALRVLDGEGWDQVQHVHRSACTASDLRV